MPNLQQARAEAIEWAKSLLNTPTDRWVILDTETTGLSGIDQVCQVAVTDGAGNVLIDNELVQPTCEMGFEAEMVHGISIERLKDAPTFSEFYPRLFAALFDKTVIIYNAAFDVRILNQTARAQMDWDVFGIDESHIQCAMEQYAKFVGDYSSKRRGFRWQKLPAGEHNALGDCQAVLRLIRIMAGEVEPLA